MKISYNWLKWYVPEIPIFRKPGSTGASQGGLADVFGYHLCGSGGRGENADDGDSLFDINILPNRAHDLLCHHGVARELLRPARHYIQRPVADVQSSCIVCTDQT